MSVPVLTRELDKPLSPVRQFLDERLSNGLRGVQRQFLQSLPPVSVPPVPPDQANPGTLGTAADWLLRFVVCPNPDVCQAMKGAANISFTMMRALADIAAAVGATLHPHVGAVASDIAYPGLPIGYEDVWAPMGTQVSKHPGFTGPTLGSAVDTEFLARACWALALLKEAAISLQAARLGPLSHLRAGAITQDALLALAPEAALNQLSKFRREFETRLVPALAERSGLWHLGLGLGDAALQGEADLVAAGLLLDLKTARKPSLDRRQLFQLIGYALLDVDDEYRFDALGVFNVRFGHLSTWDLSALLETLAGKQVDTADARAEFHRVLVARQDETKS